MNINIKLGKNFTTQYNKMSAKYGEEFEFLNGFHDSQLNYTTFIDEFTKDNKDAALADVTIDGSANTAHKDICSLEKEKSKSHDKLLSFNKIFYELNKHYGYKTACEWLEGEWNGSFYMHDAPSSSFKPYCFAYDLKDVAERGMFFEDAKACEPAQHLTTFTDFVGEFVSWTSNRTSGACGLPSLIPYMYYFWKKDVASGHYMRSPEYYRDQEFQRIIHKLNQSWLRVDQCAFTNVTIMDRPYMVEIFGGRNFPDGSPMIADIEEMIEFQKSFMRVCSLIRHYKLMTFPVLTYSLLYQNGKFVDEEFARWCSDHNCRWMDSNFFIDKDVTSLSSCCRMVNDFSKLKGFQNSIGGTALKIGSIKVNTINLARVAYESKKDKIQYMEILSERVHLCIKTLDCVRTIIRRNAEKNLLTNYQQGIIDLERQFNTIGINAMFEAMDYFGLIEEDDFGYMSYSQEGLDFAIAIMDKINAIKDSYTFPYTINIEAVPAERCAVILHQKDKLLFPEEVIDTPLYSNQWIPLTKKCSIKEKVKLGSILDKKCGGGQISHINVDAPFIINDDDQEGKDTAWELLNYIAEQGLIYSAFNSAISSCEHRHGFYGNTCPTCHGPKTDSWQRIVGFLTPASSYSKERKEEFAERSWYQIDNLKEFG